jgi:hypothetical protein
MPDDAAFCARCGTFVPGAQPVPPQFVQSQGYYGVPVYRKTNTMSVVGFVLSLFGFNVVSLILSILGLSQVRKSQMTQMPEDGEGLAIAGIIISSLSVVAIAIYFIIVIICVSSMCYY